MVASLSPLVHCDSRHSHASSALRHPASVPSFSWIRDVCRRDKALLRVESNVSVNLLSSSALHHLLHELLYHSLRLAAVIEPSLETLHAAFVQCQQHLSFLRRTDGRKIVVNNYMRPDLWPDNINVHSQVRDI